MSVLEVSETLGEALERVRQDIERLLIMRRRYRELVERMERLRNESLANYIYACPLSCEGGEE